MAVNAIIIGLLAQGAITVTVAGGPDFQIGFNALINGDAAAAIEEIENGEVLAEGDPARSLNHGIALVRLGNIDGARDQFRRVARADRLELQTSTGRWVDSHVLAHKAMALLDDGADAARVASLLQ